MSEVRLQKWMAQCGIASRRQSEKIIEQGRVCVNGQRVQSQGYCINPYCDEVTVDGKKLQSREPLRYYLYYKPAGVLTTTHDPQHRETIFDQLAELRGEVVPVGRLDMDTKGVLLLTNDGELTYRLTHPSWNVEKTYIATVYGLISRQALYQLRRGVTLEDGVTAPAKVRVIRSSRIKSVVELTIHEGKKREVRRMLKAVGFPVMDLLRVRFAGIELSRIAEGDVRPLTSEEIKALKKLVKLS